MISHFGRIVGMRREQRLKSQPCAAGSLGAVTATVAIQDAGGAVYTVPSGVLPADARPHPLLASLSPGRRAAYPLRLLGLSLEAHQ